MQLSEHQLEIGEKIVECDWPRITLAGLAGTGKTTLVKWIYEQWVAAGLDVCVLAPTGKASMVLRAKGIPAVTIHSAIYQYRGQFEGFDGNIELVFRDNKNGRFCDRIIVDEASMPPLNVVRDIEERGIPTLWSGDPGQLPPVKGKKNGLFVRPSFTLTEIHRQAAGSPIIQYAYRVRKGEPLTTRHEGINHVPVSGRGPTYVASEMLKRGVDRLIVRRNSQRVALNTAYRALTDRKGYVAKGDEIICVANNRYLGIVNGEIFQVLEILESDRDSTRIWCRGVDTGDTRTLSVWHEQFGQERRLTDEIDQCYALCDYAYAVTCHKAQGSSWKHVGVAATGSEGPDYCEWAYTGVTRPETDLTIFY